MSEPFYRATAVEPMAVVRRRHLISRKGRELVGLDDEVFDQEAIDEAGLPIAGEGALLAALERNRTGRMGDIVATIQAEQDEAIRAEVAGPLVVAGGPGTGKTAVALHRAAYLLYTFRRRLGAQGVLLVGPSPVFLRYIEHVLPSLGEQDVQLSTIAGLRPSLRVRGTDPTRPRALKGDARMARVIERAVADRERPLRDDFTLLHRRAAAARPPRARPRALIEGVHRRRGTHNEQRPHARAALPRPARRALQDRGDPLVPAPRRRRAAPTTSRASSTATTRSTRASRARSCAARRRPKAGSRSCAPGSAAGPR